MKKSMLFVTLAVVVCLLAGCSLIVSILKTEFITSQSSPDNLYSVSLYQVGDPEWPFGDVKAKLVLSDSESNVIDAVDFELANDGGDVKAGNIIEIVWLENHVEIRMREFDTIMEYTYILEYNK